MRALGERIAAYGFTIAVDDSCPPTLSVEPAARLTGQQRATVIAARDELMLDLVFPPVDPAPSLALFHALNSGGELSPDVL